MAQLYDLGYNPALDGNGEPYPGALLHTYIPGTTTPKATYTTDALSVQNANPLVADSAGRFGQMFAAEGEVFDLVLTDADGGNERTFDNVAAVGGTEAVLEKNFGVNGRFQVYGEAGVVNIETGPPTGDDIGGEGRIGGWDGTQGDALEIDYAATSVTGTLAVAGNTTLSGNLTVSGASDFWQNLTSGTCSAASSQAITLSASYNAYMLVIENLSSSTGSVISVVFSYDNGSTYKTASNTYTGATKTIGGTTVGTTSNSTEIMLLPGTQAYYGAGQIMIFSKSSAETSVSGNMMLTDATNDSTVAMLSGATRAKAFGKATNIKVQIASGTITFSYVLYGLPSF